MITFQSLAQEATDRWHVDQVRLTKAIAIAADNTSIYNSRCPAGEYDVRSQTGLTNWYHVDTNKRTCTCQDSQTGHICKHRLAVWLQVQQRERTITEVKRSAANCKMPTPAEIDAANNAYYAKIRQERGEAQMMAELGF